MFTMILRAVARDVLYVTRNIGGFVPGVDTNSQTFPVSPSTSLFSSLFSRVSLFISVSLRLFHLFFSSSLCFCAVACSVLC